jgi:predicted transcriptional regulator
VKERLQRLPNQTPESNQSSQSILTSKFDIEITNETIDDAISRCVWPDATRREGVFTASEIAILCGTHEKTAYRRINGECDFKKTEIVKIFMASLRRGGSPLTELLMQGFTYNPLPETVMESLDEEIAEETEDQGELRRAVKSGNKAAAKKALDNAKRVIAREEATISKMGSHS